ncbi:MFS transporter [Planotetraspora sp. GP83]|uniref:MFS transporter n=1 Tax=Planotetraspora sp. GP83 TaxID=3156264 RepID=UPI0035140DAA
MTQGDPRRWWIFAVLCFAVFGVSIDLTVLNVALPTLLSELHASPSDLQWIVDAYSLALAGFLLTSGSLSDRLGRKKLLLFGLVVFGIASAAGAFAHEPAQLVAARAVMGFGASFFMPGTLSPSWSRYFRPRSGPRRSVRGAASPRSASSSARSSAASCSSTSGGARSSSPTW